MFLSLLAFVLWAMVNKETKNHFQVRRMLSTFEEPGEKNALTSPVTGGEDGQILGVNVFVERAPVQLLQCKPDRFAGPENSASFVSCL